MGNAVIQIAESSEAELLALESFIERTVADRRPSSAARNYKGIARGSVFNLLRLHDHAFARTRSELVCLVQEMGNSIHAYPSGVGLKGSGTRETIDLKVLGRVAPPFVIRNPDQGDPFFHRSCDRRPIAINRTEED